MKEDKDYTEMTIEGYTIENASVEARKLHYLHREANLKAAMIDHEIAFLERDLERLKNRRVELLKPLTDEIARIENNLKMFHRQELVKSQYKKTIELPFATLKSHKMPQDYNRNDEALLAWVQNNADEYVKIAAPSVSWSDLKKRLTVTEDNRVILKDTGEIVEGLEPKPIETKFSIEVIG